MVADNPSNLFLLEVQTTQKINMVAQKAVPTTQLAIDLFQFADFHFQFGNFILFSIQISIF